MGQAETAQCSELLRNMWHKCKRGEYTEDVCLTLYQRFKAQHSGALRPPFLGYWVNLIPSNSEFGKINPNPNFAPSANAQLAGLENMAANAASMKLTKGHSMVWMLPNFTLHLTAIRFSPVLSANDNVEFYTSVNGQAWDLVWDSTAWRRTHGSVAMALPCRSQQAVRWFKLKAISEYAAKLALGGILQNA